MNKNKVLQERVYGYIRKRSSRNPITAKQAAHYSRSTWNAVIWAVHDLRRSGVKIASDENGFFLARSKKQLLNTVAGLERKREGISQTINALLA